MRLLINVGLKNHLTHIQTTHMATQAMLHYELNAKAIEFCGERKKLFSPVLLVVLCHEHLKHLGGSRDLGSNRVKACKLTTDNILATGKLNECLA